MRYLNRRSLLSLLGLPIGLSTLRVRADDLPERWLWHQPLGPDGLPYRHQLFHGPAVSREAVERLVVFEGHEFIRLECKGLDDTSLANAIKAATVGKVLLLLNVNELGASSTAHLLEAMNDSSLDLRVWGTTKRDIDVDRLLRSHLHYVGMFFVDG